VIAGPGWIETFPHRHHIDGSFAVRLRKAVEGKP
jgi:16S rRNA C967 or C1407 C5-methylase (RsmB/RsmF family)